MAEWTGVTHDWEKKELEQNTVQPSQDDSRTELEDVEETNTETPTETPTESTEELNTEVPNTGGAFHYQLTDGVIDKGKPLETRLGRLLKQIPIYGQLKEGSEAAAQGVLDFSADALGLAGDHFNIPWMSRANEIYDAHNPKSNDPTHTLIRDASAIILPTLAASKIIVGGATTATAGVGISNSTRIIASILAEMGIDFSVAAITSQSYEQDNVAGAINKLFGWNPLGLATTDGMTSEKRRHLHMAEAPVFSGLVSVISLLGTFGKNIKRINMDQKALNQLEEIQDNLRKIVPIEEADEITDAVEGLKGNRQKVQKRETIRRIMNQGDNADYDPFINQPARPEQRAIAPDEVEFPDAVGAKIDQYSIQKNLDSVDGVMRPVADSAVLDNIINSIDGSSRGKTLGEFYQNRLSAEADVVINGNLVKSDQLNGAVDTLVEQLFNPNLSFKQFQKIIKGGKTTVFRGRKFLSEEKWVEASYAWKEAHDILFNPDNLRASQMLTQQAASSVAITARSMNLLDGLGTTSRQWEILSQKMKFLVGEVQANKDIIARAHLMKKLIEKGDYQKVASFLNEQLDLFDGTVTNSKTKAFAVIDEIERIAKEHPDYMRPLAEAYDATNGDINTLYKLNRFAENSIGLLKKGIIDRNPEMPSFIIRGLHAIRYNSILNGLAPARALVGNSIIATAKPISVFTGAMATGDIGTFKKAMYTYGGLIENFKRGFKVMGDDWRLANSNPSLAIQRGRHDIKFTDMNKFEVMQSMAEAWRRDGKDGKVAMWNIASAITHWTNWKYERWGINGLYAIDGFFKSLMASGSARAKAYDALFEATNGSFHKNQFRDLQQSLYDQAFDSTGLLKDVQAKFASEELALTLNYNSIQHFESFLNHVPAAKGLFLFPRTGVNGFELTWSFNPLSNLGPAITRARRTLGARTPQEISEIMAEHGLENTPAAFRTLKSEYIGRQLMGTGVVMGAGIWALEGNLTGHGPQDGAERKRMIQMGWEPLSIKNPFNGKWHSYRGMEPFEQILSLVGDMVYQDKRVDQSITEDWFRKLVTGITMNVGNQTLTAGFEPLASLYSGDESAWNRFWASQTNTLIPQAGVRTVLNNIISPQLRDVENDFKNQLENMNRFLIPGTSDNLPNMVDIYTGKPIRFHEPMTAASNALLPFFKQNGGMEPWRQWLLSTGWDGLTIPRQDTIAEEPLTPKARQYINNYIGKNGLLLERVKEIMNMTDDQWEAEIKKYKKELGVTGLQRDFPIKKTLLYRLLDEAHEEAFKWGLSEYHVWLDENDPDKVTRGYKRRAIRSLLKSGDIEGAGDMKDELLKITK